MESTNNMSWGLDYLSYPMDDMYQWKYDGTGVEVYIVDTGILMEHEEFQGRARCAFDIVDGSSTCQDDHGHGTNVAGIVGGAHYGVAKNVLLKSVKALDGMGKGSMVTVTTALELILQRRKNKKRPSPMIVNLR